MENTEIILEDYYDIGAIKKVKKETLLKLLPTLPIKKCPECGKRLKYRNGAGKTNNYCSKKCALNSDLIKIKTSNTKNNKTDEEKYLIKIKTSNTKNNKTDEEKDLIKIKTSNTKNNKTDEEKNKIKEKYINTCLLKHGVDNISKLYHIREKNKQIISNRTEEEKNKIKEKYKNTINSRTKEEKNKIKEKYKTTCNQLYGVDNVSKNIDIRKRISKSLLNRSEEDKLKTKNKIKEKSLEIYGVDHYLKSKKVRDKFSITSMNNYINSFSGKGILSGDINKGYEYICNICNNTSIFKNRSDKVFLNGRLSDNTIPCIHCYPRESQGINQRSSIEIQLEEEIKLLGIKTEHRKDIDIYLPDYNIGIEVNGVYWHSDKFKDKNSHKNKLLKLQEEGIQILCFTDIELKEKLPTIINYIKGKLSLIPSIGASKCKIRAIPYKQAKEFCEEYHIHGMATGSNNYGLFYKEELVSVCVVGNSRFDKETIEIIRLANKTKIIGGFPRFMKLIKKDFPNKTISTFINAYLGLPNNNVFIRNGFEFVNHTIPNYFWLLNGKKLSRQQTQKHKLLKLYPDKKVQTEDEIMYELGAKKVYDAGNYKFLAK